MEKKHSPEGDNCTYAYQHYTKQVAMNIHMCALSSVTTIIYVKQVQLHIFYSTSGKAFQQSLIPHHKFYNQAPALQLAI